MNNVQFCGNPILRDLYSFKFHHSPTVYPSLRPMTYSQSHSFSLPTPHPLHNSFPSYWLLRLRFSSSSLMRFFSLTNVLSFLPFASFWIGSSTGGGSTCTSSGWTPSCAYISKSSAGASNPIGSLSWSSITSSEVLASGGWRGERIRYQLHHVNMGCTCQQKYNEPSH